MLNLLKYKNIIAFVMVFAIGLALAPTFVGAQTSGRETGDINFGLTYGKDTGLGTQDVRSMISSVINVALGLLGIVAVVIVIAGGFKWMTAGGNEEKTGEARKLIFAGIIGIAIILSAYALSTFVLTQLYNATTGGDYSTQETGLQ